MKTYYNNALVQKQYHDIYHELIHKEASIASEAS